MNLMFWKKREETTEGAKTMTQPAETEPATEQPQALPLAPSEETCGPPPGAAETAPAPGPAGPARARLEAGVIEALSGVFDPEIPVNIYELGLIYDIEITPQSDVLIDMTLTSPACPVAGSLPGDVQAVVMDVEGVRAVEVNLVWDPPWTPDRMSEAAKLELGFM